MSENSYILRDIEGEIKKLLESHDTERDVILIEGARQVGKTSVIHRLCQNRPHLWIDFQNNKSLVQKIDRSENFEEFTDLLALEKGFIPSQGSMLIIDEAQESETLGRYVRYMKENWQNQTTILLGSAMHRLFRKGIKFPVGRVHRITIHPFSFIEFLRGLNEMYLHDKIKAWSIDAPFHDTLHHKAILLLNEYLRVGGLPAIVSDYRGKKDWQDRLIELSFDYIEDYKRIHGEEKSNLFELILRRVAETTGSPSKLTTFMASSQPGYRQLPDILNLVENWGLVDKIEIETLKTTRNNRIPPKRYLFDHGIRQRFSPLTDGLTTLLAQDALYQSGLIGGVMENFTINELRAIGHRDIVGWREKVNGSEVDTIVRTIGTFIAIEVKSSLKTHQKFFSSLGQFATYHPTASPLLLISGDRGGIHKINGKSFYQIPFYAVGPYTALIS